MKPLVLFFPLLASAAPAPTLTKRQFGLFAMAPGAPKAPSRIIKGTASLYENSVKETLLWGPFKVTAANGTHAKASAMTLKLDANSDIVTTQVSGICQDCMVLSAHADLAKADGSKADIGSGVYSHHIIMTDSGQPMVVPPVMAWCPNGMPGGTYLGSGMGGASMGGTKTPASAKGSAPAPPAPGIAGMSHGHPKRQAPASGLAGALSSLGSAFSSGTLGSSLSSMMDSFIPKVSIFVGQGDEGTPMHFYAKGSSIKTGFFVSKNDKFNMMAEVVNYKNEDVEIYMTLDYEYIPSVPARTKEWLAVGMGAINVSPCESANLHPPADKPIKYSSPPWSVTADGYLLDLKPHMHDGGINSTFLINGKLVCSSRAIYGGTDGGTIINGEKWETITGYDVCKEPVQIKKGDNLTMEAWYDLTAHKLRPISTDHTESAEGMALANFLYAKPA